MSIRRPSWFWPIAALVAVATGAWGTATPAAEGPGDAPRAPRVDCASCLVVSDDGTALWSRAPGVPRPIASATKMVTALVTVGSVDLDAEVTVSDAAAAVPGGRFSLIAGETFSVRELLFGLLVGSSNDAAVALAEHVAGSEEIFVRRMNRAAADLGAARTTFTTPHGLDAPGHVSTAADLAVIGAAVLEEPLLAEIVSTPRVSLTSDRRTAVVANTNELLERYEGLVGIKTGFTAGAGNVLVAAAERQGRRLIAVALRSENAFRDARRLLDHGFSILATGVLVEEGEPLGAVVFDPAGAVAVVAGEEIRGLPERAAISVRLRTGRAVGGTVTRGQTLGTVVLTMDSEVIGRTRVLAGSSLEGRSEGWAARWIAALIRAGAAALPDRPS